MPISWWEGHCLLSYASTQSQLYTKSEEAQNDSDCFRYTTMCSLLLTGNGKPKKSPSEHHCTTLSGHIFAIKARIDNRKKILLSSNISSTCPRNMVYFGPLAAEIVSLIWGTPANFNGFGVLAALLHGILVVGVCQTLRRRGRHLYSAGRPSRWALAHILVIYRSHLISYLLKCYKVFSLNKQK